jgi:suppressor for copper-sensitivity B
MFPGVATRLPKPGAWMLWLRRVLGIALAATALWLLTVLAAGSGMTKAGVVGGLALAIVIVLAARLVLAERLRRPAGWLVAPLAVAAFLVPAGGGAGAGLAAATGGWQPFDPARIAGLVGEGRIVFVNVTADWCLTCKVNERLVLAQEPVQALLAADDVVAMQGDWTRPDEGIARYLAGFGRYGIPFDAVYGPGRPQGEALPELLTPDLVVAAIARARGDATAAAAGSMSVAGRADALTGAR